MKNCLIHLKKRVKAYHTLLKIGFQIYFSFRLPLILWCSCFPLFMTFFYNTENGTVSYVTDIWFFFSKRRWFWFFAKCWLWLDFLYILPHNYYNHQSKYTIGYNLPNIFNTNKCIKKYSVKSLTGFNSPHNVSLVALKYNKKNVHWTTGVEVNRFSNRS